MMKRIRVFLIAFAAMLLCVCAVSATSIPAIRANGKIVTFPDTQPYINADGRTMVPVRMVSEVLGAKVDWDNNKKVATISKNGTTVNIQIGSKILNVSKDGSTSTVEMDTTAENKNGRTCVPIRFVAEALGAYVDYSEVYNVVGIYSDKLSAYQIKLLMNYPRTQEREAIGYEDFLSWNTYEEAVERFGTDRNSFSNFANAREHLYHVREQWGNYTGKAMGEYTFSNSGKKLIDGTMDEFYQCVVDEARASINRDVEGLKVEFITDTSCVYQADTYDALTCVVRGLVKVYITTNIKNLKSEERITLWKMGLSKFTQNKTIYLPVDIHMNTTSSGPVNIHTIVALKK